MMVVAERGAEVCQGTTLPRTVADGLESLALQTNRALQIFSSPKPSVGSGQL